MKTLNLNAFFISLLVSFFFCSTTVAQLIGSNKNGQPASKEVSPAEVSAGGYSGEVSLFNGTFNSNYSLGKVMTSSGLSFSANLSYASIFSSGDLSPHLSGVPYGEGWNLELPTISVSTEDYNKYTYEELRGFIINAQTDTTNPTPRFYDYDTGSCDDAKKEGRLYWYAPILNIPGHEGGRLVYKEMVGDEYIFTLAKFSSYTEARFNPMTTSWTVILDDGTRYEMSPKIIANRQPSNQRIQVGCHEPQSLANVVLPKTEYLMWYVDKILNPNHAGDIMFEYEQFGCFNFFKTHSGYTNKIKTYFNYPDVSSGIVVPCKDIFLKRIYSNIEELLFNYETIPTTGGENLPSPSDASYDNLYAQISAYNPGNFDGWRRYLHIRADNMLGGDICANREYPTDQNPYQTKDGVPGITSWSSYSFYEEVGGGLLSVPFKQGYLESPRIPLSNLIPGDIYEIKFRATNFQTGTSSSFLDINLATGDSYASDNSFGTSSFTYVPYYCQQNVKGESVFSTFNQALKMLSQYGTQNTFSNFFTMQNLPPTHNGFFVQVGPAISDMKFNTTPFGLNANDVASLPKVWNAYFNRPTAASEKSNDQNVLSVPHYLRSGANLPANFGVGSPWYMLRPFYESAIEMTDSNSPQRKWWDDKRNSDDPEDSSCTDLYQWPNNPTWADKITLSEVQLIRYAKRPYMLKSVVFRVKSESGSWTDVTKLVMDYKIEKLNVNTPAFVNTGPQPAVGYTINYSAGKKRNIVLLTKISQVPADGTTLSKSETPKTLFFYDIVQNYDCTQTGINYCLSNDNPLNTDLILLEKIIDPLGKETEIDYHTSSAVTSIPRGTGIHGLAMNPASYSILTYNYRPRPLEYRPASTTGECSNPVFSSPHPSDIVRIAKNYTYKTYIVVKNKKVTDRNSKTKLWEYTFQDLKANREESTPFSEQFVFDYTDAQVNVGFATAIVKGPNANTPGGPITIYRHKIEPIIWGKLYKIEEYTASNSLVSEKELTYDYIIAFDKPWKNQSSILHPDFQNTSTSRTYSVPYFYETYYEDFITNTANKPNYLKSFFISLKQETTTKYESGGNIVTRTDYDYYDRDKDKKSTSPAYPILLSSYTPGQVLPYEPSWKLFRKKTYTPDLPALYTQEEYFYLYDLANDPLYQDGVSINPDFHPLLFSREHGIRNFLFETRTTTRLAPDENEKVRSAYSIPAKYFAASATTCHLLPSATWLQAQAGTPQIMRFNSSSNFSPQVNWKVVRKDTILEYNAGNLLPNRKLDVRGLETKYEYATTNWLLKKVTEGNGLSNSLVTTNLYNANKTLQRTTDPNGTYFTYTYDKYNRPTVVKRNNVKIKDYVYKQFNNISTTYSFENRAKLNYVSEKNYLSSTESYYVRKYVDPIGRPTGTEKEGVQYENKIYDIWDRPILQLKPEVKTEPSINEPDTPSDHIEFLYEEAPRSRILKSSAYGESISGSHVVSYSYSMMSKPTFNTLLTISGHSGTVVEGNSFLNVVRTDEDGRSTREVFNHLGQKVLESKGDNIATLFFYDNSGNIKKVVNPEKRITTYTYNFLDQLYQKVTPDDGTSLFSYNQAGDLIADKNSLNHSRVYTYDVFGRNLVQTYVPSTVTTTGIYANSGMPWLTDPTLNACTQAIGHANSKTEKKWFFDTYDSSLSSLYPSTVNTYLNPTNLTKTKGRLVQETSYNLNGVPVQFHFMSYNNEGFYKWEIAQFNQDGIVSSGSNQLVRIEYPEYDLAGNFKKQDIYLNNGSTLGFQYYYTYDTRDRLQEIRASYQNSGANGNKIVSYTYDNVSELLTAKKFYDSQMAASCNNIEVDELKYQYDARYRLTNISSTTFYFNLYYDGNQPPNSGAYTSANYNGNINAWEAIYKVASLGNFPNFMDRSLYNFQYDIYNRLQRADGKVGLTTPVSNLTSNQQLYGDNLFSYTKAGNFNTVEHWNYEKNSSTVMLTKYKYTYQSGKNRVSKIDDIASGTVLDRTLTWDNAGNQLTDTKRKITSTTVRPSRLPFTHRITLGGVNYYNNYLYDNNDRRIYKEEVDGGHLAYTDEFYLQTVHGQEIGVLDLVNDQWTWYVMGREREAKIIHAPTGLPGSKPAPAAEKSSLVPEDLMKLHNAEEITFPNRLYRVRTYTENRAISGEGYLFKSELDSLPLPYKILQEVFVISPEGKYVARDGSLPLGWISLGDVLKLRTVKGEALLLDGFDPSCVKEEPLQPEEAAKMPPAFAPQPSYYVTDHLGNTRVVYHTDVTCSTTTYHIEYLGDYYPYGKILRSWQEGFLGEKYLTTQHERDHETGLDYRGARYYDSETGRFLAVDPLADHPNQVDKSPYAYVWNNPVKFTDPDGECPFCPWLDAIVDVGFIVYDVGVLVHEKVTTGQTSSENWAALGADATSVVVPMSVGAGLLVRNSIKAANKVDNAVDAGKSIKVFGGKQSTESVTSKEAFGKAKDANGIPRSQQPDKIIKPNTPDGKKAGLDNRNVKQYEFTNSKGEKVIIRQDKPAKYGSPDRKGDQGKHYNAGKKDENLSKQHHNYKE